MRVAVCIVAFNNPEDVVTCVASLSRSTMVPSEIVICENGSAASFGELSERLKRIDEAPRIRLLHAQDNPGYAAGVNQCIRAAPEADAWWVLNPDTRPDPGALCALVRRLEERNVDAVGGRIYFPDGSLQALGGRWTALLGRVTVIGHGLPKDAGVSAGEIEGGMNFIHGASMLVSARFVAQVGLMREDYFLYCEEVEWCIRALRAGMKLGFASDAWVLHAQGTTTGLSRDLKSRPWLPIFLDERNKILLVRDTSPWLLFIAAPAMLTRIILRYARKGAWKQLGFGVAGWRAGLRAQRGKPVRLAASR